MSLRILHLAPLWHPIKQDAPGGIETFLVELLSALAGLGFRNSIIASGDSEIPGELIPAVESNLCERMRGGAAHEYIYYEQQQISLAMHNAGKFDLIHSHIGPGAYSLSSLAGLNNRVLHSQHGPVYQDIQWLLEHQSDLWISTVSEFQLRKLGGSHPHRHSIPNGINVSRFAYQPEARDGLFFMGRIERAKGPDIAVQVARELQMPLCIAGPILDWNLFRTEIEPHLNETIRYVGVLNHEQKTEQLGRSLCALMPSRWEEPFGLIAIEAMACGTPVVGLANGALTEIIDPGITGFVAKEPAQLAGLVEKASKLDREKVRARVTERFDIKKVAVRYRALYQKITNSHE